MILRFFLSIALLSFGGISALLNNSSWVNLDFLLSWFGLILLLDSIATSRGVPSLFSPPQKFFQIAIASSFFWWIYEGANIFLENWFYPSQFAYTQTEWGVFATLAFTTVLPVLITSTNVVQSFYPGKIPNSQKRLSSLLVLELVGTGILFFLLVVQSPKIFFPLIWFVIFLVLDPINSILKKRSLISMAMNKHYLPLLILGAGALFAGFWWESLNGTLQNWVYPISPYFWHLPKPFTIKIYEMPLLGYLGYIPFIWSAFAFVEFIGLRINWLFGKPKTN